MKYDYKKIDFPEINQIKNVEYYRILITLKIEKCIKRSKKIIPKIKRILKAKIKK